MRDQSALAAECREVEEAGGDVIEHLKSHGFYSPRATWERLQLNELHRTYDQLTSGKPAEGRKKKMWVKRLTEEQREKAVQVALEGGDPRVYLGQELGLKDPSSTWWNIRRMLKTTDPETEAKLPKRLPGKGAWKAHNDIYKNPTPKAPKVDKGMPKDEPLTLEAGKNYELTVNEEPEKSDDEVIADFMHMVKGEIDIPMPKAEEIIPKKLLPHMKIPKHENHEITVPLMFGGLEVTAVKDDDLGEFYNDTKFNLIDWRTPEGEEVSMSPELWRMFHERLPEIMGVLGVQV